MKTEKLLFIVLSFMAIAACSKWTETEALEASFRRPAEQDPALWARYTASLRDYKARSHYLFYARFDNAAEKPASEGAFLRSLPDSLDFVSLTHADHLSDFDREDLTWLESLGTRVLYRIDLTEKAFLDVSDLNAYLDEVITRVSENKLAGYAFTGRWQLGSAQNDALASALVARLSAARTAGQVLVFEGNPLFVPEADRAAVDYYVLDSEATEYAQDLRFQVLNALDYAGIPREKLLLGADMDGTIRNEAREKCGDLEELTRRVVSLGPLAGLGISHISSDYYSYDGNYVRTRAAIQLLNPSK